VWLYHLSNCFVTIVYQTIYQIWNYRNKNLMILKTINNKK